MEQYATIKQLNDRLLEIDRIILRAELKGTKESSLTLFEKAQLEEESQGIVNVMAQVLSEKTGHSPEELIRQQNEYRALTRVSETMKWSAETGTAHPDTKRLLEKYYDPKTPREEAIAALTQAVFGETDEEKATKLRKKRRNQLFLLLGIVLAVVIVSVFVLSRF